MKTGTIKSELPAAEQPTGRESVRFHDGMVVKAEDLETAGQYPVSLLQSVLRSYLGCGVVCGLELRRKKQHGDHSSWIVTVGRGLAVDCDGFPIELTCPKELNFAPDPCECEPPQGPVYIAIRHMTSEEVTSDPCGCSHDHEDKECNRLRDRALVKVFTQAQLNELPGGLCKRTEEANHGGDGGDDCAAEKTGGGHESSGGDDKTRGVADWCTALKDCSCRSCHSDWVLLGTVTVDEATGVSDPDTTYRRWVKPVEALCDVEGLTERIKTSEDRIETLTQAIKDLEDRMNRLDRRDQDATPPLPQTP